MSTFTWPPTYGAKGTVAPRVLSAKYGDGYEQRVAYGINYKPEAWSLNFTADAATIAAIDAFLDGQGGVSSFDWTTPDGQSGLRWLCRTWSWGPIDLGAAQLQATFEQVFGE